MWLRSDQKDMDYSWASFYPGQGDGWSMDSISTNLCSKSSAVTT
jgi:hypothetical protein